ncbi:2TM domain-containing protein [Hyunsoonleella flava]|uniref:2TM domain-containing protein n=1 Tax=Hyunsoonleella flava TaxID=2527939 RepID=A0A4Q9FJF2_9FLAO|nr:2TM domain-containing protein [Hyunsoonleella flava]TBN03640.1 2TM domain-containing protein [Hyunsoonleella flava]
MEKYDIEPYKERNYKNEDAYLRAEKRLKELKGFYWHSFWYVVVNIFIIIMIVSNGGDLLHYGTWSTPFFWGIGLGFHAIGVFGKRFAFNKKWEERKIREYMEREERNQRQFE